MAAITATSVKPIGAVTITRTTLGASDTLTYNESRSSLLILDNVTGGALTPNIDGAGGSTVSAPGLGTVSVASGYTTPSIAAGACVAIELDSIKEYLKGVITVTGGSGIKASLIER